MEWGWLHGAAFSQRTMKCVKASSQAASFVIGFIEPPWLPYSLWYSPAFVSHWARAPHTAPAAHIVVQRRLFDKDPEMRQKCPLHPAWPVIPSSIKAACCESALDLISVWLHASVFNYHHLCCDGKNKCAAAESPKKKAVMETQKETTNDYKEWTILLTSANTSRLMVIH